MTGEEGSHDAPPIGAARDVPFFFQGDRVRFFVGKAVSNVGTTVASRLRVFFESIPSGTFSGVRSEGNFLGMLVVFIAVMVRESGVANVEVSPKDNGSETAGVPTGVFNGDLEIAAIKFNVGVRTIFVFRVAANEGFFGEEASTRRRFLRRDDARDVTGRDVIRVESVAPRDVVAMATFESRAVSVEVPFGVPTRDVRSRSGAENGIFIFIRFERWTGSGAKSKVGRAIGRETVLRRGVARKHVGNGGTVAISSVGRLGKRENDTVRKVFVATNETRATIAAREGGLRVSTISATVRNAAVEEVAAISRLVSVFRLDESKVGDVFSFFVVVYGSLL